VVGLTQRGRFLLLEGVLAFLRDRDYRFSVIAALVMAITLLGLLAGTRL